jgi:hypothetical protein
VDERLQFYIEYVVIQNVLYGLSPKDMAVHHHHMQSLYIEFK